MPKENLREEFTHPLEEGWKELDEQIESLFQTDVVQELGITELNQIWMKSAIDHIARNFAKRRIALIKNEPIKNEKWKEEVEKSFHLGVANGRQEERAKVVEEVHKAVTNAMESLNEIRDKKMGIAVKVQTNDSREISLITGEMGETMLNGIVKDAKKILLSLLSDLQVNKERE